VECGKMGLGVEHVLVDHDLPTDQYMAIESEGRLLAAIADAHSLEAAGARILAPLSDGRLGTPDAPWRGAIALDGNLTVELLSEIAQSAVFAAADLRLAPASPGKADRLRPFLGHPRATFYVNAEEAGLIAGVATADARSGAEALIAAGAARALVTDGANAAVDAKPERLLALTPPRVTARRVTGAGDTFMAAHIAAETRGAEARAALSHALESAAAYVAG
ncbi:PfkB family carbohydrate kinase, partial [Nioella sp.]